MEIHPLTAKERAKIWATLDQKQKEVFNYYTMEQVTSRLLTRSFRISSRWQLVSVNIDYDWELRKTKQHCAPALYCACGRKLRYQYEVEAIDNPNRHMLLGSTHFAEHAGIPSNIAREIKAKVNKIEIYMDEILYSYKLGRRFPNKKFELIQNRNNIDTSSHFYEKMIKFQEADLPLFRTDADWLTELAHGGQRHKPRTDYSSNVPVKNPPLKPKNKYCLSKLEMKKYNNQIQVATNEALQNNFWGEINKYLKTNTALDDVEFIKLVTTVAHHITSLNTQLVKEEICEKYEISIYSAQVAKHLCSSQTYTWDKQINIPKKNRNSTPGRFLLSLLKLENTLLNMSFDEYVPNKPWENEQLDRIIQLFTCIDKDTFNREVWIKKYKYSKRLEHIQTTLQRHPKKHTKKVSVQIQLLYNLLFNRPYVHQLNLEIRQLTKYSGIFPVKI